MVEGKSGGVDSIEGEGGPRGTTRETGCVV